MTNFRSLLLSTSFLSIGALAAMSQQAQAQAQSATVVDGKGLARSAAS